MVAQLARERSYPIAVHIAESSAESDLLGNASGGFAEAWRGRGIPLPALPGRTPIAWLEEHGVLGPDTLCIHVVHASDSDLALLERRAAAVAHCPRSNDRHGHGSGSGPFDARPGNQGRDRHRLGGQRCALRPPRRSASGGQPGGFEGR